MNLPNSHHIAILVIRSGNIIGWAASEHYNR